MTVSTTSSKLTVLTLADMGSQSRSLESLQQQFPFAFLDNPDAIDESLTLEDEITDPEQDAPKPDEEDNSQTSGLIDTYLKSVKDQVDKELESGRGPECYRHGLFFIYAKAPYFSLKEAKKKPQELSPHSLCYPDIFLWLPDEAGEKESIKCPNSSCAGYKTKPMSVKGWNDNPVARHIIGLTRNYYILTR